MRPRFNVTVSDNIHGLQEAPVTPEHTLADALGTAEASALRAPELVFSMGECACFTIVAEAPLHKIVAKPRLQASAFALALATSEASALDLMLCWFFPAFGSPATVFPATFPATAPIASSQCQNCNQSRLGHGIHLYARVCACARACMRACVWSYEGVRVHAVLDACMRGARGVRVRMNGRVLRPYP